MRRSTPVHGMQTAPLSAPRQHATTIC
jgi:hypothetical protein